MLHVSEFPEQNPNGISRTKVCDLCPKQKIFLIQSQMYFNNLFTELSRILLLQYVIL